MIASEAARLGIVQRAIDDEEIVERCIYALIVEGARVLEEGIAGCAADIDVIWLNGYGFPRHRGGPMYHADSVGLPDVLAKIRAFHARFATRDWEPPQLIEQLARENRGFKDLEVRA